MRSRIACAFVLVMILAATLTAQVRTQSGAERFRLFTYQDRMTGNWAFKFLMPEGWQFQGGINWLPRQWKVAETQFSVGDPQGTAILEFYPDFLMIWTQNPQLQQFWSGRMMVMQPVSAVQLLETSLLPQSRGNLGYRIVTRKSDTQAAQALTQQAVRLMQVNPCFAQLMANVQFQYDVGQVDITYNYINIEVYESVIARVIYIQYQMQPIIMWGPESIVSLRTDTRFKEVNQRRFLTLISSFTENPVFQQKLCEINLNMVMAHQEQINSIGELSAYISRTSNEISDIVSSTYRAKDAAYDRVFHNFSDAIMGVNTYTDGDVEFKIPVGNQHVWKSGDTVVYSDNPNFNPNTVFHGSWQPLQQRR